MRSEELVPEGKRLKVKAMDKGLLIPIVVLFASTIVITIIKRLRKDNCLKCFHGSLAWVLSEEVKVYYGELSIHSNCMALDCHKRIAFGESYLSENVLYYDADMKKVHMILAPVPEEGTREFRLWEEDLKCVCHPGFFKSFGRTLRNMFNILRDAFSKAISMLIGAAKNKTPVGKIPSAGKGVDDVGAAVLESVSNSYEPLLEARLGCMIGVKVKNMDQVIQIAGIIQEYNSQYLLLRDISILPADLKQLLPDLAVLEQRFDMIVSRQIGVARFKLMQDKKENVQAAEKPFGASLSK